MIHQHLGGSAPPGRVLMGKIAGCSSWLLTGVLEQCHTVAGWPCWPRTLLVKVWDSWITNLSPSWKPQSNNLQVFASSRKLHFCSLLPSPTPALQDVWYLLNPAEGRRLAGPFLLYYWHKHDQRELESSELQGPAPANTWTLSRWLTSILCTEHYSF